jgi:Ca-activated chloride channel family protein
MGRGVVAYLALQSSGERQIDALFQRLENPVLQDLAVDWNGLDVREVYPAPLPDLFAGSPVVVTGRFHGELPASVTVSGQMGDGRTEVELPLTRQTEHPALTKLWARSKIGHLNDNMTWMPDTAELAQAITDVSLEHGVISQFTAFVAADASRVTEGDHGVTVQVPVPVPAGVRYDTTVGK